MTAVDYHQGRDPLLAPHAANSMNSRLVLCAITSALAGFIFGFDTVVISGAEQKIQGLWQLTPQQHGWAMSAALWGTVLGAVLGSVPTELLGRRRTLISVGLLYLVSAIWSGLAVGPLDFSLARFIGGVGIGVATVAAPLYIAEISPPRLRGRLTGLFQFNIVFGILMAYVSNALLRGTSEHDWRWMLGVEAIPAAIYSAAALLLPESPRWLMRWRGEGAAAEVLRSLSPSMPEAEVQSQLNAFAADSATPAAADAGEPTRLLQPLLIAFLVAAFNQFSGINAVLYFSKRIFEQAGFAERAATLNTVGIGLTNLVATMLGLWLIDRVGRRVLLLVGSVGYIASLGLCSWGFASGNTGIVPWCIFAFIASHAVGQGAVIWVLISEVFPNRSRALGQSVGSATHWVFAALITLAFPAAVASFPPWQIFAFFCGAMVLQLIWVLGFVPETKNVPLEQMGEALAARRPARA